jgi:hypothetical protein
MHQLTGTTSACCSESTSAPALLLRSRRLLALRLSHFEAFGTCKELLTAQ